MLVQIKQVHTLENLDEWDYENAKFVAAHRIKSYDKFVRFIQTLKKYHKDLIVNDKFYTVEDYAFNFPADSDTLPCLYVYVSAY